MTDAQGSPAPPTPLSPYRPIGECAFCDRMRAEGTTFFPSHTPSRNCQSGGHPHCTCDWCF